MEAATGSISTLAIGIGSPFRDTALRPPAPHFLTFPSKHLLSVPHYRSFVSPSRLGKKTITVPCSGQGRGFGFSMVKASLSSDPAGSAAQIAPLQLQSPIGQFLSQILTTHPHLLPAAVDQQLQQLQIQRHAEEKTQETPASATHDIVLHRRIAEVKANERKRALEEILYALVVQRFMDADVPLIPTVAPYGRVVTWSQDDEKLERLHSSEAREMIQNHLALVLGNRIGDFASVVQISKLRVGQVYAASVMYGYFLKRVDERFQLEKTVKMLPADATDEGEGAEWDSSFSNAPVHPEISSMAVEQGDVSPVESGLGIKPSRLRTYVMSFDGDTLQRLATIRSKEAVSIIERHTEALFGRPQIAITPQGTVDTSKDELIKISFGGLKRLVMEAVTFGSFLWDVETYVDSRYHFVMN
ncbi:UV-B-induced protein At3g17800, chloroplastic-like isoform X1 [Benincasa hispida]|uniref:UV-B-induced protein At3g17800, chloroplastic-like isoform X1 n=1 Tax=Benincasa hispida TaxID=102211 RepID=UPI001901257B|nr:UV-B-induced protein At3g17800, chloroplastic-like isoform X1 [Benincasa hispida]